MVRFSDPSDEQENFDANRIKDSPDGRHVAIVTTRGLLESDQLESTLSILDLEHIDRFLRDPSRPVKRALKFRSIGDCLRLRDRIARASSLTAEPLFRRSEAAVQERLFPLQQTFAVERAQQRSPRVKPYVLPFPPLQPSPASRRRRILVGQKPPRRSGLQHPQDDLQTGPVGRPRTAPLVLATLRLRQQRLNQLPLRIVQ